MTGSTMRAGPWSTPWNRKNRSSAHSIPPVGSFTVSSANRLAERGRITHKFPRRGKKEAFHAILKNRLAEEPIRVWVPGCSTGEEAYSIAICLLEYLEDSVVDIPVQIFAT